MDHSWCRAFRLVEYAQGHRQFILLIVKQPGSTAVSTFFNYAGKAGLTVLVLFVFLFALVLVLKIHSLFLASQSQSAPPIYVSNAARSPSKGSSVRPFWPEFPRSNPGMVQSAVINGVQIITEEWEDNVSPLDVLAYYREQMTARGWRDATEETYSLQPNLRENAAGPQDENFVANYRKIMDSTLMLNRQDWSIHLTTQPGKKDPRKTAVKIYAAAAPSLPNYIEGLGAAMNSKPGLTGRPLDALQQNGRERYHTTIATSPRSSSQAFQEKLVELGAIGWRPAVFLPKEKTPDGRFVWLVRDKQYAALSVKALPQGKGSTVTFAEVTPN